MNLPEKLEILIITLSDRDRAYKSEYNDLSGPRVKERISEYLSSLRWNFNIEMRLIPDDSSILREILRES